MQPRLEAEQSHLDHGLATAPLALTNPAYAVPMKNSEHTDAYAVPISLYGCICSAYKVFMAAYAYKVFMAANDYTVPKGHSYIWP